MKNFAFCRVLALASALSGMLPTVSRGQESSVTGRQSGDTVRLTAAEVVRLSLTQEPAFLAWRIETSIARGGLRQARVFRFNPDVTIAAPGAGLSGVRNPLEATLMGEFEIAGQRGLRTSAARIGVTQATERVQNAAREGVAAATVAFYRALSADRRLAVTRDGLELATRLQQAVRVQVREGEISSLEGTLAEIEFGRARARVLEAERLANASLLELQRITGLGPNATVRLEDPTAPASPPFSFLNPDSVDASVLPVDADSMARLASATDTVPSPPTLDVDSLVRLALEQRPDLAAATALIRQAEAHVSLARREALPNLRVGALAERVPSERGYRIGPAVGISLPLWNRNQGLVEERRALVRQARLQRDAMELRVRTDVETAVRSYRAAWQEAATFELTVRQPARVNSARLETAFRAGKIALPTLLLLRNQLLDAELGYWDAWLARQDALTRLEAATGRLAREALAAADTNSSSSDKP